MLGSRSGEIRDSLLGLSGNGTTRTIARGVGLGIVLGVTQTDLWFFVDEVGLPATLTRVGSSDLPELSLPELVNVSSAWARGPADVWIGGENGTLAHYDGKEVSLIASDDYGGPVIYALWGSAATTWAAGESGWILRRAEH